LGNLRLLALGRNRRDMDRQHRHRTWRGNKCPMGSSGRKADHGGRAGLVRRCWLCVSPPLTLVRSAVNDYRAARVSKRLHYYPKKKENILNDDSEETAVDQRGRNPAACNHDYHELPGLPPGGSGEE